MLRPGGTASLYYARRVKNMTDKKESDKTQEKHRIKDVFKDKKKPPKKLGHGLNDKRPHFKSFKSPGVK